MKTKWVSKYVQYRDDGIGSRSLTLLRSASDSSDEVKSICLSYFSVDNIAWV